MSEPSEDYVERALEATRQLDNLKAQRPFAEAAENLDNEPNHPEFEHNLIHSIDLAGKIFGANSVESALRLDQLGLYYFKVGRYPEATRLFQKVLKMLPVTTEYQEQVRATLYHLCFTRAKLGDNERAEEFFARADQGVERTEALRMLATSFRDRAQNLVGHQNFAAANACKREALWLLLQALEQLHSDSLDWADLMMEIAYTRKGLRLFPDAEHSYRAALEAAERCLGPENPKLVKFLEALASFLPLFSSDLAISPESELLRRRSLYIAQKAYGPIHPEYAKALAFMGWHYLNIDDEKADRLFASALVILERTPQENAEDLTSVLHALHYSKSAIGQRDEAISALKRVLAMAETIPAHPPGLIPPERVMHELAEYLAQIGDVHEAEQYFVNALTIFRAQSEKDSRTRLWHNSCLRAYSKLLRQLNRNHEADALEMEIQPLNSL